MISVNQGAGSSFPEKVEKGKTQDVSYQGGTFELGVGLEIFKGRLQHGNTARSIPEYLWN